MTSTLAKHQDQMEHQGRWWNDVPTSMLRHTLISTFTAASYSSYLLTDPTRSEWAPQSLCHVFWVQSCTYYDCIMTHGSNTSSNLQMLLQMWSWSTTMPRHHIGRMSKHWWPDAATPSSTPIPRRQKKSSLASGSSGPNCSKAWASIEKK